MADEEEKGASADPLRSARKAACTARSDAAFHLSFDAVGIADLVSPATGLTAFPTLACYSKYFMEGEQVVVVRVPACVGALDGDAVGAGAVHAAPLLATSDGGPPIRLPPRVGAAVLAAAAEAGTAPAFDFYFVVNDMSAVVECSGHAVNLVHHAWAAPGAELAQRTKAMVSAGVFTTADSHVLPLPKVDMAFQCLSKQRISIHPMKGGAMACSPNNARILVGVQSSPHSSIAGAKGRRMDGMAAVTNEEEASTGPSFFWSIAVADPAAVKRGRGPTGMPICVTLSLVYTTPGASMPARLAASESSTVAQLLDALASMYSTGTAAIRAAQFAFCLSSPADAEEMNTLETPSAPVAKGGGGRSGNGAGGGDNGSLPTELHCAACGETKDRGAFSKAQRRKTEHVRRCITCVDAGKLPSRRAAADEPSGGAAGGAGGAAGGSAARDPTP